jgi:hypothetical protein
VSTPLEEIFVYFHEYGKLFESTVHDRWNHYGALSLVSSPNHDKPEDLIQCLDPRSDDASTKSESLPPSSGFQKRAQGLAPLRCRLISTLSQDDAASFDDISEFNGDDLDETDASLCDSESEKHAYLPSWLAKKRQEKHHVSHRRQENKILKSERRKEESKEGAAIWKRKMEQLRQADKRVETLQGTITKDTAMKEKTKNKKGKASLEKKKTPAYNVPKPRVHSPSPRKRQLPGMAAKKQGNDTSSPAPNKQSDLASTSVVTSCQDVDLTIPRVQNMARDPDGINTDHEWARLNKYEQLTLFTCRVTAYNTMLMGCAVWTPPRSMSESPGFIGTTEATAMKAKAGRRMEDHVQHQLKRPQKRKLPEIPQPKRKSEIPPPKRKSEILPPRKAILDKDNRLPKHVSEVLGYGK